MSATIVEPVIAPQAIDATLKNTVGDSVPLTVEDLATFLPSLKGSVTANVKVILARYGYSPVEEVKVSPTKSAKKSAVLEAKPLPEAVDGGRGPCAADYRLSHDSIDHSLCLGRRLDNGEDKRWKPIIYRESQCSSKPTEDSLCKSCHNRQAKYVETGKPGPWNGLITEEPPSWCHMLGSQWATEKNVKFNGAAASGTVSPAGETAVETVVPEQMPTVAAPVVTTPAAVPKAAEKAAAKATKDAEKAEKEAAKAAEKAKKEAEKAEKEAAKVAEKAKKEAEKAEKAAAKKEKPAKKTAVTAPAAETVAAPVKADTSAPVTKTSWELKLINGSLYSVTNGNVYEYDELQQKPGDFVGRLTADETIDSDAEEVMGDESDSE